MESKTSASQWKAFDVTQSPTLMPSTSCVVSNGMLFFVPIFPETMPRRTAAQHMTASCWSICRSSSRNTSTTRSPPRSVSDGRFVRELDCRVVDRCVLQDTIWRRCRPIEQLDAQCLGLCSKEQQVDGASVDIVKSATFWSVLHRIHDPRQTQSRTFADFSPTRGRCCSATTQTAKPVTQQYASPAVDPLFVSCAFPKDMFV